MVFLGNRRESKVADFVYFLPELFEVKAAVRPNVFRTVGVNIRATSNTKYCESGANFMRGGDQGQGSDK